MKDDTKKRRAEAYHQRFDAELGDEWQRLTDYKGSHEMLTARHIPCGEIRTAPARDFFRRGCYLCEHAKAQKERAEKRATEYILQIESKYNVTSVSAYKGAREPHTWRCNICGTEIDRTIENILFRGNGYGGGLQCECHKRKQEEQKELIRILRARMNQIKYLDELQQLCEQYEANGYEVLSIHGDMRRVTMRHKSCGYVFVSDVWRMRKGYGCKECSKAGTSYGVQQIERYLTDNNIAYKREATFQSCKRERVLPFDFAVYDNAGELKCLIEFQGEQHYRASAIFGGEEKLKQIQESDAIKRQWAKENGINLIVIDWNEKIDEKVLGLRAPKVL